MSKRKLNLSTNQRLTLGISLGALIVAIVSTVFAAQADQHAKEANRIANRANDLVAQSLTQALPEVEVSNWDQGYYDLYLDDHPCVNKLGNIIWRRNLIVYIDITNIGGRTIALIDSPKYEWTNTINGIHVKATFTSFYFLKNFDEWLQNSGWKPFEEQIREHARLIIPLNLAAGETRRVVLGEHIEVRIDSSITPKGLFDIIRNYDWTAHLQLRFAQDKILQADIPISMPYMETLLNAESIPPFEACQN